MQDFISELENQYHQLLSREEFQEYFTATFNHFLHIQAIRTPPYAGLKRHVVFQQAPLTLYRYQALTRKKHSSYPLLIIYAFVNRPTILDIQEERSFIKKLLEHHVEVYLLDWGNPLPQDKKNPLKHYIYKIKEIIHNITAKKVNVLGICQGGTLSLCAAALPSAKIRSLITMVTPVDFKPTLLGGLLKKIDTQILVQQWGNIPGPFLSGALQSLKPFRFLRAHALDQDFFLRMEKWMHDCPDHPGLAFHEFIYHFYQKNNLAKGYYFIDKTRLDLSTLRMPILNITAAQDHLVPPLASDALKDLVGSLQYESLTFTGGHIGVFVSQKALNYIPSTISHFLS